LRFTRADTGLRITDQIRTQRASVEAEELVSRIGGWIRATARQGDVERRPVRSVRMLERCQPPRKPSVMRFQSCPSCGRGRRQFVDVRKREVLTWSLRLRTLLGVEVVADLRRRVGAPGAGFVDSAGERVRDQRVPAVGQALFVFELERVVPGPCDLRPYGDPAPLRIGTNWPLRCHRDRRALITAFSANSLKPRLPT